MSEIVISVENLTKIYQLGTIGTGTFANDLKVWWAKVNGRPNPTIRIGDVDHHNRDGDKLEALSNLSFTVNKGEAIGIIGQNGAGKSTLLKVLSRVTKPTSGKVKINGRVSSLLEVGTGFHPELTGRENIFLNGVILGMNNAEVRRKFDEIVAFSEIEQFIDTPVKRYSSGMYVRLAFAVAAHLDPDILIVDEVLAVGDINFRRKSLGKMESIRNSEGRTVLFVSHDMISIRQLCTKSIWIQNGKIREMGDTASVTYQYENENITDENYFENPHLRKFDGNVTHGPKISSVELKNNKGDFAHNFNYGDTINLKLSLVNTKSINNKKYSAIWFLLNENGQQLAVGWSYPMDNVTFDCHSHQIECQIGPLCLPKGRYRIRVVLHIPGHENYDDFPDAMLFNIVQCDPFNTGYDYPGVHSVTQFIPHKWQKLDDSDRA